MKKARTYMLRVAKFNSLSKKLRIQGLQMSIQVERILTRDMTLRSLDNLLNFMSLEVDTMELNKLMEMKKCTLMKLEIHQVKM